jgi:hypothetical protein
MTLSLGMGYKFWFHFSKLKKRSGERVVNIFEKILGCNFFIFKVICGVQLDMGKYWGSIKI